MHSKQHNTDRESVSWLYGLRHISHQHFHPSLLHTHGMCSPPSTNWHWLLHSALTLHTRLSIVYMCVCIRFSVSMVATAVLYDLCAWRMCVCVCRSIVKCSIHTWIFLTCSLIWMNLFVSFMLCAFILIYLIIMLFRSHNRHARIQPTQIKPIPIQKVHHVCGIRLLDVVVFD